MAERVDARIVYWGIAGAGKSSNLRVVYGKLKAENRGELQEHPTRLDPTVTYEELPIELGEVGGQPTRLQLVTVPSGMSHAPTRKQLLDEVAGIVIVVDAQRDRIEENIASLTELREMLASYGRSLSEIPVVVQYNKSELSDAYAIEELHRQLALPGAAAFEAVASEGTGVLKTLTTVSKGVVRQLRATPDAGAAAPRAAAPADAPAASAAAQEAPAQPAAPVAPPEPAAAVAPSAPVEEAPIEEFSEEVEFAAPAGSNAWMEDAILREAEAEALGQDADPEQTQLISQARQTFDVPYEDAAKAVDGARLGSDLEIVSIGEASRTSARGLQVPVVLGNSEGETVTIALRIELDPLVDEPA